jgi:hypothetical protein
MNNLVYALLVVPMILILSTAIYTNFGTNISRAGWTTDANATYDSINTQTWAGYKLGSLLPYVLIAVTIISVILAAFGISRLIE